MADLIKYIKTSNFFDGFLKKAAVVSSGAIIAQAINFIFLPLISRLYTPDDFGFFANVSSISGVIISFFMLKYESAILIKKNHSLLPYFVLFSLISIFSFSLIIFSLFFFIPSNYDLKFILSLLVFCIFNSIYTLLVNIVLLKGDYFLVSRANIAKAIVLVSLQVGLFYTLGNGFGLVWATSFSLLLSSVFMYLKLKGFISFNMLRSGISSLESCRKTFIQTIEFPKNLAIASLINSLSLNAIPILLVYFFGSALVGSYFLLYKVIGLPMGILGRSLSQVYIAETNSDFSSVKKNFLSTFKKLLIISLIVIVPIILIIYNFSLLIFGEQWTIIPLLSIILTPFFLLQLAVSPLTQTLNLLNLHSLQLKWDFIRSLFIITSTLFVAYTFNDYVLSMIVYSFVMSLFYIIYILLVYAVLNKK
ncbi:oligosaccharide flippase family protein [Vibrio fluvialis]|uniref:oligosaccharide flippase family protein n=1 Tax=Vibrio fluvialis TaxID=676 RepID=UPI0027E4F71A|nr:oligosaccharide flippase family protein [Vibrio fluvialis]WMN55625.1 oligosaccharide flippase family protein [Vibrio fluvialis]